MNYRDNRVLRLAKSTGRELWVIIFAAIILTFFAMAFGSSVKVNAQEVPVENTVEIAKPVKLLKLSSASLGLERAFFGRVSAKQTVDLAFQINGQLIEFELLEGAAIKKGDLIAKLDPEPFQIALERALVSQTQADRVVARFEKITGGSVSRATVEEARSQAELAAVAVRDAEYAMERTELFAPFDAIVASRITANFTTVGAGAAVIRLHDMSELRVKINVPEVLFQQIGENPNLVLNAKFPASDKLFPIEFREVNAEASQVGQTFDVTFGMMPPENLLLLPGASATVFVTLSDFTRGIIVPASAIRKEIDGSLSVMRFASVDGDKGRLTLTPVDVAIGANGEIEIISGVSDDMEIVTSGVDTLSDGETVRRFKSF